MHHSRELNFCFVELTTVPADEHLDQQGVAVRVEFSYDESGCRSAEYWKSTTRAMQWLERENPSTIRVGPATPLKLEVAASLLDLVRSAKIGAVVEGRYAYIHATIFRLTVSSLEFSCDLSWSAELPPEWHSLQEVVQTLMSIGSGAVPN
ncbi:hypothetical protein [Variovorax sp. 350MFTsu5.1]|uniref:hypothetical protein n=1 Tax=Variovorax sp. 350MFTsu5.1 TaxID=3158365 RepID=UPI003AABBD1C